MVAIPVQLSVFEWAFTMATRPWVTYARCCNPVVELTPPSRLYDRFMARDRRTTLLAFARVLGVSVVAQRYPFKGGR